MGQEGERRSPCVCSTLRMVSHSCKIARLEGLGARLLEGPIQVPTVPASPSWGPDDIRVEPIEPRKSVSGGSANC